MTQHSTCVADSDREPGEGFSPDGKTVAVMSSSIGDTLQLFDADTATALWKHSGRGYAFNEIAFNADGRLLCFASSGVRVTVLDVADGHVVMRRGVPGHGQLWPEAAISPDGTRVCTANGPKLRVYDVASHAETLALHLSADCDCLRFSPDGTRIATLGKDGIHLWDAASGQPQDRLNVPAKTGAMEFGGCSHVLLTIGEDRIIRVWDAATGAQTGQLDLAKGTDHLILAEGGRVALVDGSDDTLRVWDVPACQERTRMPVPAGLRVVTVSSDGTRLATCTARKSVDIWSLAGAPADSPGDRCASCAG